VGWRKPDRFTTYVALVNQGLGHSEAATRAGVGRSTGWRWRRELAGHPTPPPRPRAPVAQRAPDWEQVQLPALIADAVTTRGRHLIEVEREIIADLRGLGWSLRQIAAVLDRAPSTISRELARNSYHRQTPTGPGRYGPHAAHRLARQRRRRPKPRKLALDPLLHAHVQKCLTLRWSPRQIAKTLPRVFPDQPERHLAHETIYQGIYHALFVQGRGRLRTEIAAALRTGRPNAAPTPRRPRAGPGSPSPW
jgi:hypothetical protein